MLRLSSSQTVFDVTGLIFLEKSRLIERIRSGKAENEYLTALSNWPIG